MKGSVKMLLNSLKKRRSRYDLTNVSTLSDDALKTLVRTCVKHIPTAFNSQSGRVVLALHKHHDTVWDIVKETLRKEVPEDKFEKTAKKINGFKEAYGTVLFFNHMPTIEHLQKKFPLYSEKFSLWADQSQGMLQYCVWTRLAEEGMGASLQHYNPLIDDEIKRALDIPNDWQLEAQMPFGSVLGQAKDKDFKSLDDRVKVLI